LVTGRLLVVDDEIEIANLLAEFFTSLGYQVDVAHDADAALAAAARRRPDAVVLDVAMPGVSGEEALARLHRLHPALPIVMLTGHADEPTARRLLRSGAFDFVAKPVQLTVLERIVTTAVTLGGAGSQEPPPPPGPG
jgi:DNA-binding NtrC family response regulator